MLYVIIHECTGGGNGKLHSHLESGLKMLAYL